MSKLDVIAAAIESGYFKAKSEEKRETIFDQLVTVQCWDTVQASEAFDILQDEAQRRSDAYKARAARDAHKAVTEAEKPLTGSQASPTAHVEALPAGRYILTTAQNNTDIDADMLGAVLQYCSDNNARLLVAKTTYNKNGFQQATDAAEPIYYAAEIVPYLVTGHINLGGAIDFLADSNVLPTAKNPLSGFQAATLTGVSAVIPAVKIALQCTATLKGGEGKILYSTGAITKRNYILRKAGQVALTEHNIGALFVDTLQNPPVIRQLERVGDCVGFYDEGNYYTPTGSSNGFRPAALQFGDIHAEKMEDKNLADMLALICKYQPINAILHDVCDFSSRNHHNIKDCAFIFAQHVAKNTVKNDIQLVTDVIDELAQCVAGCGGLVHIIESNHDLAINTWLKNSDFKQDPVNAVTYLECMLALYKAIEGGTTDFNMLEFAYKEIGAGDSHNVIFHKTDESVIIAGVEMGCHGHTGINGSRGSPQQFRTLGIPLNTGHTHTPSIVGACYTAGVSASLEMGYNVGPSSWRLANVLTWPNGQRQVIFM